MSLEITDNRVLERASESPTPEERPMSEQPFKSEFLRTMQERGYIHQITHPVELDEAAAKGAITAYIGFDATAASPGKPISPTPTACAANLSSWPKSPKA